MSLGRERLYGKGIENISEVDILASVAYLFLLTKDSVSKFDNSDDEAFGFVRKAAEKLECLDRLNQVTQDYVKLLLKHKVLHPYVMPETEDDLDDERYSPVQRRKFARDNESFKDFKFEEDVEIDNQMCLMDLSENLRNYYRVMFAGGKKMFSQILYYTFFSKAKVSITQYHNTLPVNVDKKINDTSSLDFMIKELELSDEEARYLLLRYRKLIIEELTDALNSYSQNSLELYTKALGISKKQYNQIIRSDAKLRQFGFLDSERVINPAIYDVIEAKDLTLYFSDCIKNQTLKKTYPLNSFSVPAKNTSIYKSLLQSDEPVSILLYGAPGTGKTEYAKALIKNAGKKALIFKNESEVMDKDDVFGRLNCLLSLNRKDTVLIVDEADSLLSTSMMSFFGPVQSSAKKGVVNKMLETSQNKVIWIVNHMAQMDESTLRRFTVSHKFEPMSVEMLEQIAANKFSSLDIDNETKKGVIKLLSQYKVTGASVENLIKTINSMKNKKNENLLENLEIVLKDNSSLLHGEPKMRTHVKSSYDMSVLNTSISSKKIMDMLFNAKKFADKNPGSGAVRILFYGLSGTGKTEFARYISEKLGKEILLKRASDILDKYVGGTEHNIADAFEEAAKKDMILLFDEADSFFADRNNAQRSYERTQVNEFLTQLEEFSGIVICTTNLRNIMDPAMLRRFHITVDFKALTKEGITKLLKKFFKDYDFGEETVGEMISDLSALETVTPGDFSRLADTIKFMDSEEINSKYIIEQLCEIQKEKGDQPGNHRSIGFTA